jgi:hypothetical protein
MQEQYKMTKLDYERIISLTWDMAQTWRKGQHKCLLVGEMLDLLLQFER